MLPKGLILYSSSNEYSVKEAVYKVEDSLDRSSEKFEYILSNDCKCLLGVIRPNAGYYPHVISFDNHIDSIGIIDGVLYSDHIIKQKPHSIAKFSSFAHGTPNGMFVGAAYSNGCAFIITDAFGTTPLYYHYSDDCFSASTSLRTVAMTSGIDLNSYSEVGVAQILSFGKILGGHTLINNIHRLNNAEFLQFYQGCLKPIIVRYWEPSLRVNVPVAPSKQYADLYDAFSQAVKRCVSNTSLKVSAGLSGGIDSRTIWSVLTAEGINMLGVTHGMKAGYDVIYAAHITSLRNQQHLIIRFGDDFLSNIYKSLLDLFNATNYVLNADNVHLCTTYPILSTFTDIHIDGNHSNLECRLALRNTSINIKSQESFEIAIWKQLTKNNLASRLPSSVRCDLHETARAVLSPLMPIFLDWPSAGLAADYFNIMALLPHHGTDAACLQNHYCRYLSPYFDLDYIDTISQIQESDRWRQYPQLYIIKHSNKKLLRIARSYTDVWSPIISSPIISRLPVAWHRMAIPPLKKVLPSSIINALDPYRPTVDYSDLRSIILNIVSTHSNLSRSSMMDKLANIINCSHLTIDDHVLFNVLNILFLRN